MAIHTYTRRAVLKLGAAMELLSLARRCALSTSSFAPAAVPSCGPGRSLVESPRFRLKETPL
jgi:hypothetical protein